MSEKEFGMADLFPQGGSAKYTHEISGLRPLRDVVLVRDMSFGERRLASGLVLLGDDAKSEGIRPRWAKVYATGPEQQDVEPGQWVLIEHGRWSRGFQVAIDGETFMLRLVDPDCIMFVSDEEPDLDETLSTALSVASNAK